MLWGSFIEYIFKTGKNDYVFFKGNKVIELKENKEELIYDSSL